LTVIFDQVLPAAALVYAVFTRFVLIPNGAFTRPSSRVPDIVIRRHTMLDLIYLALSLAVFAAFAIAVRAAERM
jgi:hypothetical protein